MNKELNAVPGIRRTFDNVTITLSDRLATLNRLSTEF